MAHINFVIPQNKNELLSDNDEQYYVRNVLSIKEIQPQLRATRQYLKDEGPEYILENFDTYYSVLHHAENLQMDVIMKSFEQLHRAVQGLNNVLGFLLEDKDNMNDELKQKYLNVVKMLLYIYASIIQLIEQKNESRKSQTLTKGKPKKKMLEDELNTEYDKRSILLMLHNIIQRDISLFWDPPVVEESFTNIIAEVGYRFLETNAIRSEKEIRVELFNMLGTLIRSYNHGMVFVIRIGQLIKIYEHLVTVVPEGIQILVQNYGCKSLVRDFIREITEWQTDEKFQDAQGTKNCSNVLFEMANLMPDLMIPEVMYLTRYLAHDAYTLRNSVLHVISEVVLSVLTKNDLSDEQKECRDDFLAILEEHIDDISALVRSKVFQQWAKLQQENAIPLKIQAHILEKAVAHLRDKGAVVRKCAANCVTTFLSHNIYGAKLQLNEMQAELQQKQAALNSLKESLEGSHLEKLREVQEQWLTKEEKLRAVIEKNLLEGNTQPSSENNIAKKELSEIVRVYIMEEKYEDAFNICRSAGAEFPEWAEARASMEPAQQAEIFVLLMRTIFTDISINDNGEKGDQNKAMPDENDLKQLETLERSVEYLNDAVGFLQLIDSAIKPMADLLESASVGDMQEAIEFFIAAYHFNINNALSGVLEMLKIMQRNEKERKDCIINAFKNIYLTTDSSNMREHTITIVERLIRLLQMVPFENIQDLHLIVSEWTANGILDNSVIDMLWQYFTKKEDVSDESSRAALYLLMMAAMGRRTIITKNIKLVATVAFGERGQDNPLLITAACQMLQIAGREKQDITSSSPAFRIKVDDPMWKDLVNIIIKNFCAKSEFYNGMVTNAIECIYRLCSKPEKVCETLLDNILSTLRTELQNGNNEINGYLIAQTAHMVGEVALKQLNFLDESVYKELKRRNYIREERKYQKKPGKTKKPSAVLNASTASASKRMGNSSANQSLADLSIMSNPDDSVLEGAQAEDADAEFILNVLENNTVTESSSLGKLAYLFVSVCERPEVYDNLYIQGTAVTALLRYMTVSSRFCEKHIQLIFTILEKTNYPEIKSNILVHCSDLLERFPNIIEPWTPHLYERLRDNCTEVRTATFFMLANLILRDMIRVQGYISEMACCIVDDQEHLREMSKNFFTQLSHKANKLYNVLPDIFSHLCDQSTLTEENLRFIMKFLFGLIDKNKQMENLVDRFCSKFRIIDDNYKCCNIAYCLSLIPYNEKGLRRLQESFPYYKNTLQHDGVYLFFKQILTTCSKSVKNEIKEITAELEEKINSVFEINENNVPNSSTPSKKGRPSQSNEKSAFKKPRGRPPKKKTKSRARNSDSDDEAEVEKENASPMRRTTRPKRASQQRKVVNNDGSGSDSD